MDDNTGDNQKNIDVTDTVIKKRSLNRSHMKRLTKMNDYCYRNVSDKSWENLF